MSSHQMIRLVTQSQDGIFQNSFNDGITISPFSDICLQSACLRRFMDEIEINGRNQLFEVRFGDNKRFGVINTATYNYKTILDLLQEIQDSLNDVFRVQLEVGSPDNPPAELGYQLNISVDRSEQIHIDLQQSVLQKISHTQAETDNPNFDYFSVSGPGANQEGLMSAQGAAATNGLTDHTVCGHYEINTGASTFYARIRANQANAGRPTTDSSGFILALISKENRKKVTNQSLLITDIEYAVELREPLDQCRIKKPSDLNFTNAVDEDGNPIFQIRTTVEADAANYALHDIVGIEINAGRVELVFYDENTNPKKRRLALSEELDRSKDYIPLIIIRGPDTHLELSKVECMLNPFGDPHPDFNLTAHTAPMLFGSTLKAPQPSDAPTIKQFAFPDLATAEFLGFDFLRSNLNVETSIGFKLQGSDIAQLLSRTSYVVELLNLNIDSYDGQTGGRKNILASIPVTDRVVDSESGIIDYEPNTFNFININNAFELKLRDIRLRILDNNLKPVPLEGVNIINLIVRNPNDASKRLGI